MGIWDNKHVKRIRAGFWIVVHYVIGMFYNFKAKELRQLEKKQREVYCAKDSRLSSPANKSPSTCSMTLDNDKNTKNGPTDQELKPIEGAITPDVVTRLYRDKVSRRELLRDYIPNAAPPAKLDRLTRLDGILICGPRNFPQFIPEDKIVKRRGKIPYRCYERGFLKSTAKGVIFYPETGVIDYDVFGQPKFKNVPQDFQPVGFDVYRKWQEEKEIIDNERRKLVDSKVKIIEKDLGETLAKYKTEIQDLQEELLEKRRDDLLHERKLLQTEVAVENQRIFRNVIVLILLLIFSLFVSLQLCGVFSLDRSAGSSVASECVGHSNPIIGHSIYGNNSTELGGTGTDIEQLESSGTALTTTPVLTTTTTKAYPNLTQPTDRVHFVDLIKPTFEIVSSEVEFHLYSEMDVNIYEVTVIHSLKIINRTDKIQLHFDRCDSVTLNYLYGPPVENISISKDMKTKLLTITLLKPVDKGNLTLEIEYRPAYGVLDQMKFPCGTNNKTCTVFLLPQPRLLFPHFAYTLKQKWSFIVLTNWNETLLTNTKIHNTGSAGFSLQNYFKETNDLLPCELSFVATKNLDKIISGKQVDSVMPDDTNVDEVKGLVDLLETTIQSMKQTSTLSKEKFSIVVVPPMENYEFNGRNVALVGTSLLRSNKETKMEFVWRWIYRSVIYDKVTSSDGNPTWVYEQSAFFLSTIIKSNNTKLWKKHLYELAMEGGLTDMQPPVNPSTTYEDEQRYLDKPQHFAKVSTVLGMLTGLGVAVSGDPLTNLDANRDQSTSGRFFFLKSTLKLENDETIDVDKVASCYIDSPDVPFVLIRRTTFASVTIQRPSGGSNHRCDMHLLFVRDTSKTTREHKLLSDKAENVQIQTNSAILLSGDSPLSAYGYSMDQQEFDKLLDSNVLVSFDASSVNLLAFNAFQAAAEGTLTYESLRRFMKVVLLQKIVSVDEAVDLWMGTVIHSRNDNLESLTESIVVSVLKDSGDASTKMTDYIGTRLDKSVKEAPLFEIEQVKKLFKYCGKKCFLNVGPRYFSADNCATGMLEDCIYDPHLFEIFACSKVATGSDYDKYNKLYETCKGKPCRLPVIRGLLCTKNEVDLKSWLDKTTNLSTYDMGDRQEIQTIFQGLASNVISKPWMLDYVLDNWYLLHKKHFEFPVLIGDVVDSLAATVSTREQLDQLKQFVAFYGDKLSGYKEFKYQASKAEKALEWNNKFSQKFSALFN